jgi:TRAP-type mannitol/chloroaromatic compound transport system permease small subunit
VTGLYAERWSSLRNARLSQPQRIVPAASRGALDVSLIFRLSIALDRIVSFIGALAAWLCLPLIAIIVFDVITRRFFVLGSTKLQELEWHLHAMLFFLCIGWAYIKNAHVRIELVHERLSRRTQLWIELLGCLLFLIPYSLIVLYHGVDWWERSWSIGETSDSATGLPYRWAIKIFLPIGFVFIFLAAFTVFLRKVVELFGPPELAKAAFQLDQTEREPSEAELAALQDSRRLRERQ